MPDRVLSSRPVVDVCLATYRRPAMLSALLESLAAQVTENRFSYTINVCDNDSETSAKPVVDAFALRGIPVRYRAQPERNISLARNDSIDLGSGELVAIIDDDEVADRHWLAKSIEALTTYRADVVHGRVLRQFPPGHANVARSGVFDQPCPPAGSTTGYVWQTTNCMLFRSVFSELKYGFDPTFGRSGGGDTEFFTRAHRKGYRMVFSPHAITTEYVHPERATARWLLARGFREGINNARVWAKYDKAKLGRQTAKAAWRVPAAALLLPLAAVRRRTSPGEFYPRIRRAAFSAGVFSYFLGLSYHEY